MPKIPEIITHQPTHLLRLVFVELLHNQCCAPNNKNIYIGFLRDLSHLSFSLTLAFHHLPCHLPKMWDLDDALSFGNYKAMTTKPELLKKLINKDVIHGYSLPIPLSSVKSILGLVMALMNIMAQHTINEHGQTILKDRLSHNPS